MKATPLPVHYYGYEKGANHSRIPMLWREHERCQVNSLSRITRPHGVVMRKGPKITMVGAGGMSFGPSMVNDVVNTPELTGSQLVLHDINENRLQRAYVFAAKLNAAHGAPVVLDRTADPAAALDGADFVLSSAEISRFRYWHQDFEIAQ